MPDALDHATGLEKKELLATLAGIDDPYHNKPVKRGAGTKDKPTMVPSAFDARIIGCICKLQLTFTDILNYFQRKCLSNPIRFCFSFDRS